MVRTEEEPPKPQGLPFPRNLKILWWGIAVLVVLGFIQVGYFIFSSVGGGSQNIDSCQTLALQGVAFFILTPIATIWTILWMRAASRNRE